MRRRGDGKDRTKEGVRVAVVRKIRGIIGRNTLGRGKEKGEKKPWKIAVVG